MRIAHFSDLHVLSLEGVGIRRLANKRLTGYANLKLRRGHVHRSALVREVAREIALSKPDHVVITGDLTNLALEAEFAAVRLLLREELGMDPADVSIVPGNHDLYTRGSFAKARFLEFFASHTTSDTATGEGWDRFPFVRIRGPVAIIGLLTALPRAPFFASGRVGHAQAAKLRSVLALPEVANRTPVLLMHHPLYNPASRRRAWTNGLEDAHLLRETLAHVREGLILHGHLHTRAHRVLTTEAGRLDILGATSASLEDESSHRMAGFNLYEISNDGFLANVEAHVLDRVSGKFRTREIERAPLA